MERNEQGLTFEERVDRFVIRKLAQDQINDLWVEVIEDKAKYNYLKTAVALNHYFGVESAHAAAESSEKPKRSRDLRYQRIRNIAAAAGISLVVGVGSVYWYSLESTTGLAPLAVLDYATVRGNTEFESSDAARQQIQDAIVLAQQGSPDAAIYQLQDLYESTRLDYDKAQALLNIGIIEYNRGAFQAAELRFEQLVRMYTADVLLLERSTWYLAQSYLAQGKVEQARETMGTVVNYGGAHSRAARQYLNYLR